MQHNSLAQSHRQLIRERARFMRHHPTYSEALLFQALRGKRLGVSFRRQQVIGNHIVDFLSREASLIVEIDGDAYHATRLTADRRREEKLVRAGYTVLRLPASMVESRLDDAVALVRQALVRAASR